MVSSTLLLNGVLGSQGDAAEDDYDHDEGVEAGNGDDAMDEDPNPKSGM